jgi:hypothetical protein
MIFLAPTLVLATGWLVTKRRKKAIAPAAPAAGGAQ